jgi:hypothetical protein
MAKIKIDFDRAGEKYYKFVIIVAPGSFARNEAYLEKRNSIS